MSGPFRVLVATGGLVGIGVVCSTGGDYGTGFTSDASAIAALLGLFFLLCILVAVAGDRKK